MISPMTSGGPRSSSFEESPQSRLSNRVTLKPRDAMSVQNASSHSIIWYERPITSSSGVAPGSPKLSYSISRPFT